MRLDRLFGVLACLFLIQPNAEAYLFGRSVDDYSVGLKLGKVSVRNQPQQDPALAVGADIATKLGRSSMLNLSVQSNGDPELVGRSIFSITPGIEFYPFPELTELKPSIGFGAGYYKGVGSGFYTENERQSAMGVNFGGALDITFSNWRMGIASRYHTMITQTGLSDFFNFMFRVGFDWNVS